MEIGGIKMRLCLENSECTNYWTKKLCQMQIKEENLSYTKKLIHIQTFQGRETQRISKKNMQ